jgi:hypothetical protein
VRTFTTRYFLSLGNVFFSLILGVASLAFCAIFFENFTLEMSHSTSPKMEIIARLILHESAILVVGFTIAARIVLGAIIMFFAWLITGRADHIT